jgi:hypothetical protein
VALVISISPERLDGGSKGTSYMYWDSLTSTCKENSFHPNTSAIYRPAT